MQQTEVPVTQKAILCLITLSCWIPATLPGQDSIRDWDVIARAVISRMSLTPGERVLLVGMPGKADSLVPALRAAVRSNGATDLGAIGVREGWPEAWATDFTRQVSSASTQALAPLLDEVDLAVMLPGARPSDPLYAALQDRLRSGQGRTIHFHWAGAYTLDGVEFDPTPWVDTVYREALLKTNYPELAARQRDFEAAMRRGDVRVTTPAGTDLRFRIGDRAVTRQDGDASKARTAEARTLIDREVELPAGAVRVAPLETTVNGRLVLPVSHWGGERVEGLVMQFENGTVTSAQATGGLPLVERELAIGGTAARAFRELVVGFNPFLRVTESNGAKWIPYYGYGAGVVRVSFGDNTELGGNVRGGYVRWNLLTDATVTAGGKTWIDRGRLVP
jgi:hypothetical protein